MSEHINKCLFGTLLKMFTNMTEIDNIQHYSHKWNVTYTTAHKNIYEFENLGLMETEKTGRQIKAKLTERGRKMTILFKQINNLLEEGKKCSERKRKK
jgi:predicted transcriptional regulator